MGLLRSVGRAARRVGDHTSMNGVPWLAATGALMGGASAAGNGGDMQDIGRSALIGGAMGGGGAAVAPGLGILGALGAGAVGMNSTHGDVDAAARKIVMATRGDPNNIERVADLLYGGAPTEDEQGYGRYGRSNRYGVSTSDQVGMSSIDVERKMAVQRAREMMGVQ